MHSQDENLMDPGSSRHPSRQRRREYSKCYPILCTENYGDDNDKDQFYETLQTIMAKCPTNELTIPMGDLNVSVGMDNNRFDDIMRRQGLNDRIECSIDKPVMDGRIFSHKHVHKATWVSSDHTTENQIDHICISKTLARLMEDVRSRRGTDKASNHH
ncbi:unnamed protein product [Schistosoma curassoni]|uniref:Endo/exonuclease/phosphatase domain-containing protein n=1 Tax=Schistosoma curassoni TaxID=6186 RepID=A0A183KFA8_9TREM|nr:unnamed protein product [Schistosoma curassoni]